MRVVVTPVAAQGRQVLISEKIIFIRVHLRPFAVKNKRFFGVH
jgi:hypothetical protein